MPNLEPKFQDIDIEEIEKNTKIKHKFHSQGVYVKKEEIGFQPVKKKVSSTTIPATHKKLQRLSNIAPTVNVSSPPQSETTQPTKITDKEEASPDHSTDSNSNTEGQLSVQKKSVTFSPSTKSGRSINSVPEQDPRWISTNSSSFSSVYSTKTDYTDLFVSSRSTDSLTFTNRDNYTQNSGLKEKPNTDTLSKEDGGYVNMVSSIDESKDESSATKSSSSQYSGSAVEITPSANATMVTATNSQPQSTSNISLASPKLSSSYTTTTPTYENISPTYSSAATEDINAINKYISSPPSTLSSTQDSSAISSYESPISAPSDNPAPVHVPVSETNASSKFARGRKKMS